MNALSSDAQRLIFGFLRNPGSDLHFVMMENQPTARTRSALSELCDAGLIEKSGPEENGEKYTRTSKPPPTPTITAQDIFDGDEWNLAEKIAPEAST